jgi:hypothetical protein
VEGRWNELFLSVAIFERVDRPTYPSCGGGVGDVDGCSPRAEVCKHDSNVNSSREGSCAKTANRLWRDFGEVDRSDDSGLTNTETSNEAASVDHAKASAVAHKYDNTEDPESAKLTSSPETAYAIAKNESPMD